LTSSSSWLAASVKNLREYKQKQQQQQ